MKALLIVYWYFFVGKNKTNHPKAIDYEPKTFNHEFS